MRISPEGNDMYICQLCARDRDSVKFPPVWRTDLTKCKSAGNVCPECLGKVKPNSTPEQFKKQVEHALDSWVKQSQAKADFLEKLIPFLDWSATNDAPALRERLVSIAKVCNEYAAETTKKQ